MKKILLYFFMSLGVVALLGAGVLAWFLFNTTKPTRPTSQQISPPKATVNGIPTEKRESDRTIQAKLFIPPEVIGRVSGKVAHALLDSKIAQYDQSASQFGIIGKLDSYTVGQELNIKISLPESASFFVRNESNVQSGARVRALPLRFVQCFTIGQCALGTARQTGSIWIDPNAQNLRKPLTLNVGYIMLNRDQFLPESRPNCLEGHEFELKLITLRSLANLSGRFLFVLYDAQSTLDLPKPLAGEELNKKIIASSSVVLNGQPQNIKIKLLRNAAFVNAALVKCDAQFSEAQCQGRIFQMKPENTNDESVGVFRPVVANLEPITCTRNQTVYIHRFRPVPLALPKPQPRQLKETDPSAPPELYEDATYY